MGLINQSLQELEWPQLLSHFSALCRSTPAKLTADTWLPAENVVEARDLLNATEEAIGLEESHSLSALEGLVDLRPLIERIRMQSVLSAKELLETAQLLQTSRTVKGTFGEYFAKTPRGPFLARLESTISENQNIEKRIFSVVDEEGNVRDQASELLRTLRGRDRKLHSEAREKIDAIVQQAFRDGLIQDRFSDFREGRYVIPVKREFRNKITGNVADSSSSKATVYIEPTAIRAINDRLRQNQVEIEEEVYRILREISLQLAPEAPLLQQSFDSLIELDLALARARLAIRFAEFRGARKPEFSEELELEGAYHPLLSFVMDADRVVRNSLRLDSKSRVLLISGPNTGGKTVLLKTIGLSSLMARGGFFLSCSSTARIPFFPQVLARIGDSQSIELSLSSFSGSVAHLKQMIETADPRTLILIDEILHETDPDEAAALAKAVLLEFRERGSFVVVTTHLNGLKMAEGDLFQNASMEFDEKTLSPTYRLRFGVPGSSHALDIAARLGLSGKIVERARGFLKSGHQQYERVVASLKERELVLKQETDALTAEKDNISALRGSLEQQLHLLNQERTRWRTEAEEKLTERVREVSQSIQRMVDEFKAKIKDVSEKHQFTQAAKEVTKVAEQAFKSVREEFELKSPKDGESSAPVSNWKIGALVYVKSLKTDGILQTDRQDKPAEVLIGKMKMRVPWHELKFKSESVEAPKRAAVVSQEGRPSIPAELNIIGKTVEDAEQELAVYLDRASRSDRKIVRIVHGHGSGALKRAVREFLQRSDYAVKYRPGERSEGGDGCTVVEFE